MTCPVLTCVCVCRSLVHGILFLPVLLEYSIIVAYLWGILTKQRNAGMRLARFGHTMMWGLIGMRVFPMENNTSKCPKAFKT